MTIRRAWQLASPFLLAVVLAGACSSEPDRTGPGTGGSGGTVGPGGGGGTPPIGVGPSAGERLFVPRIIAADGAIWDHKQMAAIFWFGRVDSRNNHTQVRVGYGDQLLMLHAAVFDQKIYEDAQDDNLSTWDSITLLFDLDGAEDKTSPDERCWRIDAQAHRHGTERTVVYQGAGGQWGLSQVAVGDSPAAQPGGLNITKGYRGEGRDQSRGWHINFFLGWSMLGLSGPPLGDGERMLRVAMIGYDRDDAAGTTGGEPQYWPAPTVDELDPSTWGRMELLEEHFASWSESGSSPGQPQPAYAIAHTPEPYMAGSETAVTIRHGLDGDTVENAAVGASEVLCSGDDSYNFGDGPNSWGGNTLNQFLHVQNQEDYADWPCFAKVFLKFPLTKLPADKVVISASLILHHKQPTSGGNEGLQSLVQAFPVAGTLLDGSTPWTADNLSWNNAPIAFENVAGSWVDRTSMNDVGWDNLPEIRWDVSRAVAATEGESHISFALYSADSEYHTGKEFVRSSDFEDWGDQTQRPTLEITFADPAP